MSKLKELKQLYVSFDETVTQFTGNHKGNWISRGYAIWKNRQIVFCGTFQECQAEYQRRKEMYDCLDIEIEK